MAKSGVALFSFGRLDSGAREAFWMKKGVNPHGSSDEGDKYNM
jgi:hypothetical protein